MKRIRCFVSTILRSLARRVEPDMIHLSSQENSYANTAPFFGCLKQLKFSPVHVVDIGANRGNWTRTALRYFPDACFTLFEPQSELLADSDLRSMANVSIFSMGVGPKTATMKLSKHVRDDSFSFALSSEEAARKGRDQIDVPVVALDEFLESRRLPYPDMLKIDAEGWDLEVLKGAEKSVKHAEVVLLEASVLNKEFRNKLQDVIREMSRRCFVPFDITDLNRTSLHRALWLVEMAFVQHNGRLERSVSRYE